VKRGFGAILCSVVAAALLTLVCSVPTAAQPFKIEMVEGKSFANEERKMVHFAFRLPEVDVTELKGTGLKHLGVAINPEIKTKSCMVLRSEDSTFAFAKQAGGYVEIELLDKSERHIFTVTTKWESCRG
jgi:hypothetical protein